MSRRGGRNRRRTGTDISRDRRRCGIGNRSSWAAAAATADEIHASALQFVRKLSGFNTPSQANKAAFDHAVAEVSDAARRLLTSLHTNAPARDRDIEAEKAR